MKTSICFLLLFLFVFNGCKQKSGYSEKTVSKDICACLASGSNSSLDSCMNEFIDKKNWEVLEYKNLKSEFLDSAISEFTNEVTIEMIHSCDLYYNELNLSYDNIYPLDSSHISEFILLDLGNMINKETNPDSLIILLNKRIAIQLRRRNYNSALNDVEEIKSIEPENIGAISFAAYIFNQKGYYDMALNEYSKLVNISDNMIYSMWHEMTKRRLKDSKNNH